MSLCEVRKNHDTGDWHWKCPQDMDVCHAETYETHGSSIHWELALHFANEHALEHHQLTEHLTHDMGTPPGGFRLADNEATVSMPIIIGHTHTMKCQSFCQVGGDK